jgi:2-methylcitrate dehydratase PrpD
MGVSSHNAEEAKVAREIIKSEESDILPPNGSTLFCDGTVVSSMGAAFANSVLITERAQEDTLGTTHVGVVVTPAVLAISEKNGNLGKEVLEAIIVGYEVAGTLDKNLVSLTTPRCFRATPIFGIVGCAAAVSKLLELPEDRIANALGFAASFAGGTLESIRVGTKECRFQGGVAAREGILSALIAKKGIKGAPTSFEGKDGYLNALANTQQCSDQIGVELGKTWEILNVGFKPYPVCVGNQISTMITLDLVKENDIDYRNIKEIKVKKDPYFVKYPGNASKGPFSSVEGTLMSLSFTEALACIERDVTLAGLHQFNEPRILELIEKVIIISDDSMPLYSSGVEIGMKDGSTYYKEIKIKPDYFNFNMERTIELINRVTLEAGVSQGKVEMIISLIRDMEKLKTIKELTKILANCP